MIDVDLSPGRIRAGDPVELDITLTNSGTSVCTNVIFTLRLPAGIARLHGQEKIVFRCVLPGQRESARLGIRGEKPGRYPLTITNFSYRDQLGRSRQGKAINAEIIVDPAPEAPPPPQITVELLDPELPYRMWTIVRARLTNAGATGVGDLEIRLSGQVTTDRRTARGRVEQLPAGRSAEVAFHVLAEKTGTDVPVHLDLTYQHQSRRQRLQVTQGIRVIQGGAASSAAAPSSRRHHPVKILILAANPVDSEPLGIGSEIREIQNITQAGQDRDNFELAVRLAVQPDDIRQALLDEKPWLVHFAGHGGDQAGSFAAESEYGLSHVLPVGALVDLFGVLGSGSVECVLVNACETEMLARELSAVVPCAIGMRRTVHDKSAVWFSRGFYQALAAGKSVDDAFRMGVIALEMAGAGADTSAPVLFRRDS